MIKKFGTIRLKREHAPEGTCEGCFFNGGMVKPCTRPYDHNGAFRCSVEVQGDWIADEDDDEGGYHERYEDLFIWCRMLNMNKKTRVI